MSPAPCASRARSRRRAARVALAWLVAGALLLHVVATLAMDVCWPRLRDPEYGRRADGLRERIGEHPERPAVVVLGSSRASAGVRPDAWEAARPGSPRDVLLFNMGMIGAGPVQELMTLKRLHAGGFRPAVVLVEYWPVFLRQDGNFAEANRVEPRRLLPVDRAVVRSYFPDPEATRRRMFAARLNPLAENGGRWAAQVVPEWLPKSGRLDACWQDMDGWGWRPGAELSPDETEKRRQFVADVAPTLRPWFVDPAIHPDSDRALREMVALARAGGARVGFVFLPESSELRGWYSPEFERAALAHLAALSGELGVPVIDARRWMEDGLIGDALHLTRLGAAEFTRRLGPAVGAAFPELGGPEGGQWP